MSRQLRCPNCGGEHTLVNPGITMLVCDFCKTVVYWDEETALQTGVQSILPEADTRLFMHATGKLQGLGYEVVGHLRYDHGRGTWDEWYLQLDNGGVAWLSEDERELTLEQAARPDSALPPAGQLQLGQPLSIKGQQFTVRELGQATCVGGEGQLPFTLLPGEQYPYADVASLDGQHFGTLEYDEQGAPTCFVGQVLTHEQLTVDEERPPSTAGSTEGQDIRCPNCDAPLEMPTDREVETRVCEYCGAQNDLSGAEAKVMGRNPADFEPDFQLEIGQAGAFEGRRYEVCGRLLHEDQEGYQEREYLLFNPDAGYLWLAEENNHFLLNQPTQEAPPGDVFQLPAKHPVRVGDTTYRFYEAGVSRIVYVDGALPWLARSGDRSRFADLVAPPLAFGVETNGQEVEYFKGVYLSPAQVWEAFEAEGPAPRAYGVGPAQPFSRGPVAQMLMVLGGISALVNLLLLGWSLTRGGQEIFRQTFTPEQYLKETLSQPFTVGTGKVMTMTIGASLDNSWLALQVALVDDQDRAVAEAEGDIAYYYGVEGGESWSEGSREADSQVKAPPPGTYRLLVNASAGRGEVGPPRGEPLTISLKQGVVLSRYFLILFVLSALFPIFEAMRRGAFEQRRWAPVAEDDDDDD